MITETIIKLVYGIANFIDSFYLLQALHSHTERTKIPDQIDSYAMIVSGLRIVHGRRSARGRILLRSGVPTPVTGSHPFVLRRRINDECQSHISLDNNQKLTR